MSLDSEVCGFDPNQNVMMWQNDARMMFWEDILLTKGLSLDQFDIREKFISSAVWKNVFKWYVCLLFRSYLSFILCKDIV